MRHVLILALLACPARAQRLSERPLTADTAVQVALSREPSLAAARMRELGAEAAARAEGRPDNPRLTASSRSGNNGEARTEIGLSFDLWTLLGAGARRRARDAEVESAREELAEKALALAAETKAAFFDVEAASAACALSAAAARSAARSSQAEEAAAEEAGIEAERAGADLSGARARLARLMRAPSDSGWWTPAELPEPPQTLPEPAALAALAHSRRPALKAALAAARAAAERARAWSPRTLGEDRLGVSFDKEPDGTGLIGPSIEADIPVFQSAAPLAERGFARAEEAKSEAEAAQAELAYELESLRARADAARRIERRLRDRLIPLRAAIAARTGRAEDARAEAAARRAWVEALREYWTTRAALERAVGGSLDEAGQGEKP